MKTLPKILIVDDDEVVRRSFLRTFAATRCETEAVGSWSEVSRLMKQAPFDVVLLDLRMPEMDGLSVLKALKASWPKSEVIIVTGYPTLESAKEAVTLGAYDYLAKPVWPEQILEAANAAMLHKQWALQSDAGPDPSPTAS